METLTKSQYYQAGLNIIERYEEQCLGIRYVEVNKFGERKSSPVNPMVKQMIEEGKFAEIQIEVKKDEQKKEVVKNSEILATPAQIDCMERNQISYPTNVTKKYASFLIEQGLRG